MSTAIYVRVSTERQTLAQTIEQQVERLIAHMRHHIFDARRRVEHWLQALVPRHGPGG